MLLCLLNGTAFLVRLLHQPIFEYYKLVKKLFSGLVTLHSCRDNTAGSFASLLIGGICMSLSSISKSLNQ
jgi:hypothetical protein